MTGSQGPHFASQSRARQPSYQPQHRRNGRGRVTLRQPARISPNPTDAWPHCNPNWPEGRGWSRFRPLPCGGAAGAWHCLCLDHTHPSRGRGVVAGVRREAPRAGSVSSAVRVGLVGRPEPGDTTLRYQQHPPKVAGLRIGIHLRPRRPSLEFPRGRIIRGALLIGLPERVSVRHAVPTPLSFPLPE